MCFKAAIHPHNMFQRYASCLYPFRLLCLSFVHSWPARPYCHNFLLSVIMCPLLFWSLPCKPCYKLDSVSIIVFLYVLYTLSLHWYYQHPLPFHRMKQSGLPTVMSTFYLLTPDYLSNIFLHYLSNMKQWCFKLNCFLSQ